MNRDLTLQCLRETNFPNIYKKFILNYPECDYKTILSIAVILINSSDENVQKLGYSIIVEYCNRFNDYSPLYDISINMGLYPIAKYIYNSIYNKETCGNLFLELNDSFMKLYEKNGSYLTYEQKRLYDNFIENVDSNLVVVAPTSYGKTELIISLIQENVDKNICVITPTKSLLSQTKRRIANARIDGVTKIITHPEMYTGKEKNLIAVLTQERLLRLLEKSQSLKFDYVVIDEAHDLLNKDDREILLASVLIMLVKRNPKIVLKFLTPFLKDPRNLEVKLIDQPYKEFYVKEYIKSEKFYIYDYQKGNGTLELYDQYMDQFYKLDSGVNLDELYFVENKKSKKNIVYLNKPKDIEDFAKRLSNIRNDVESPKIYKACKAIAEYVHPQYNLLQCLKKGIIYHHGSIPDFIRIYIERLYSEIDEIEFVVTSSTLLEGVNLPAERMFILDKKKGLRKLTSSNFKNLIGRVCRFSEIFKSKGSLDKLLPHIYIVNGKYYSVKQIHKFLTEVAKIDNEISDNPENVLLEAAKITEKNEKKYKSVLEALENYQNGIIEHKDKVRRATTEVGKYCFLNNITEFPILDVENAMQKKINRLRGKNYIIDNTDILMEILDDIFFCNIPKSSEYSHKNILRLRNESAQKFYAMFLDWRINGVSYSQMVQSFLYYWKQKIDKGEDCLVYVGRWGDRSRDGKNFFYVDIREKKEIERINLAIVRIKEEQDFVDNVLIKYIEVLNDLGFFDNSFYLKIKFGTDDERVITLVENGISLSLSKLIADKYPKYVKIDVNNSVAYLDKEILHEMEANNENPVLINEASYFVV